MSMEVKAGGTWRTVDTVEVKVAGVWKTVDTVEVKVAGVWKTVFTNRTLSLAGIPDPLEEVQINTAVGVDVTLEADGDIGLNYLNSGSSDVGDWITPKALAGANYEARMTVNSGDALTSGTVGSWLSLGSSRLWGQAQASNGVRSSNVTLEIRDAATLAVLVTLTFDIYVENASL